MLTPRFQIDQDNECLQINIRAPYCNLNDFDIDIYEKSFLFYCKPYFLRLTLPKEIVEDDKLSAKFDADTQSFVLRVSKRNRNEHFPDLDLMTSLLQPTYDKKPVRAKVEVVNPSNGLNGLPHTLNSDELTATTVTTSEATTSDHCYAQMVQMTETDASLSMSNAIDDVESDHNYVADTNTEYIDELSRNIAICRIDSEHNYTKPDNCESVSNKTDDEILIHAEHNYAECSENILNTDVQNDHLYTRTNAINPTIPITMDVTSPSSQNISDHSLIDHNYTPNVTHVNVEASNNVILNNATEFFDHTYAKREKDDVCFDNFDTIRDNNVELDSDDDDDVAGNDELGNSWLMSPQVNQTYHLVLENGYGFANKITDYLDVVHYELGSIFDDVNVMKMSVNERRLKREQFELSKFDQEHYASDLFDTENYSSRCLFVPEWHNVKTVQLTDEERDVLKDLPNREHLLNDKETHSLMLGLVDILFAYFLEKRIFYDEITVESGWGINKISATFSWLETFNCSQDVIISSFRRALIFPLVRNFCLAKTAMNDVTKCLSLGKLFTLKNLLAIRNIFNNASDSEPRYILNEIYVNDYCVFIQKVDQNHIDSVCEQLATSINVEDNLIKSLINLNLVNVERKIWQDMNESESETDTSSETSTDSSTDSDDSDDDSDDLMETFKTGLKFLSQ